MLHFQIAGLDSREQSTLLEDPARELETAFRKESKKKISFKEESRTFGSLIIPIEVKIYIFTKIYF
jgi:hypothetical protein